jgi:hypothetical protein
MTEMPAVETDNLDNNNDLQPPPDLSEQRNSISSSIKRSNSDVHLSPIIVYDEDEAPIQELKPITKPKQTSQIPKLIDSTKLSTSMVVTNTQPPSLKVNASPKTR